MSGNEFACSLGSSSAKIAWVWTQKTRWKTLANNACRYSSRCVRALRLEVIYVSVLFKNFHHILTILWLILITVINFGHFNRDKKCIYRLRLQQLIGNENNRQRFSLSISRVCPQCTSNFSWLLKLQDWIPHFYGQNASKNSGGNRMRCCRRSTWSKLPTTWEFCILSFKLMH